MGGPTMAYLLKKDMARSRRARTQSRSAETALKRTVLRLLRCMARRTCLVVRTRATRSEPRQMDPSERVRARRRWPHTEVDERSAPVCG